MIILNSLFPIFALLLLGSLLKKAGITNDSYLKTSDRMIYYIFFPVMLFWKIGGSAQGSGLDPLFLLSTLGALCFVIAISLVFIILGPVNAYQAGSFSQSCYRFNTYIGVAVILNSFGEAGIAYFGVLIALVIPLVNLSAVSVLIWFSGEKSSFSRRSALLVKALVANPLIIASFLGIIYAQLVGVFPVFVDNTLKMMSMVTLPLALLSIGGSLSFGGLKDNLGLSLVAAGFKLLLLPLCGFLVYRIVGLDELAFKVGMIFLSLPTSTAIYVLSSQLKSDTELASAAIVLSTLLSFISLSVVLLL